MPTTNISKEVRYLNKNFVDFRNALINHAKVYFPDTFNDFNESSIGMMFIEMCSYVGDVLSYYTDTALKESLLLYADDIDNVIYLAQDRGYKYKTTVPAVTNIDVFQLIPAIGSNGENIDFNYALRINENMVIASETFPSVEFRTTEPVDFSVYDSKDFTANVFSVDSGGNPTMYLIKKSVPAVAGIITTQKFSISNTQQFLKLTLSYDDVIEILDVYDDNGNRWHEVEYLAQDTVLYDEENNDKYNDQLYIGTSSLMPSRILKMKRVSKRFTTKRNTNGYLELNFGSGKESLPDQILIPTPQTIQYNNTFSTSVDIANSYLNTRTYGAVPFAGTTLTVRFTRGGGIQSNVPQGDLTNIRSINIKNNIDDYITPEAKNLFATVRTSVAVSNPDAATGGKGAETIDEIRQNAISYFSAQDRAVTQNDYLIRTLSMPAKYGNVSKAYVEKDASNFSINIYTLGYDYHYKLIKLNDTIKQNLITYISHYRDLTTGINIKDAYIINIGVKFSIITISKYNKNEILLKCIQEIIKFFNIDKWQIGQPIILRDLYEVLDSIEGVRTVSNIEIINKYDPEQGYSNNYYDIPSATSNGIIYTSADPSIWELKFPSIDIEGMSQ